MKTRKQFDKKNRFEGMSSLRWGMDFENKAQAEFLRLNPGAKLIAKNYRTRVGELDLVFEVTSCAPSSRSSAMSSSTSSLISSQAGLLPSPKTELVIIEVRVRRTGLSLETGIESLRLKKQFSLSRTIRLFLQRYRGRATEIRLDVMAWDGRKWTHYQNIGIAEPRSN